MVPPPGETSNGGERWWRPIPAAGASAKQQQQQGRTRLGLLEIAFPDIPLPAEPKVGNFHPTLAIYENVARLESARAGERDFRGGGV